MFAAPAADGTSPASTTPQNPHGAGISAPAPGPADIPADRAPRATDIAEQIATALAYVGVLAVEMFVVPGDGESVWTLTHATDFAKGLVGLLGNPAAAGEAFHITSDEFLTWNMIHAAIGAALGASPRIVHVPSSFIARIVPERAAALLGDKATSAIFDNSKIRRFVPDFRPSVSFAEGIRRSVAWYDARPRLKIPNPAVNGEMEKILEIWHRAESLAGG